MLLGLGGRWTAAGCLRLPGASACATRGAKTGGAGNRPGSNLLDDLELFRGPGDGEKKRDAFFRDRRPDAPCRTFGAELRERREQAKRSLLVQVRSRGSAEDLFRYCTDNLGTVRSMHFHKNKDENSAFLNFYVVEFEDPASVSLSFETCHHRRDRNQAATVPVYSPFLWLAGKDPADVGGSSQGSADGDQAVPVYLPVVDSVPASPEDALARAGTKETLSEQISEFYNLTRMTDLSSRLRFLACEQVELAISGLFPKAEVVPFGSSVNGCGTNASDLDMTLTLDPSLSRDDVGDGDNLPPASSRLIFHAKSGSSSSLRTQVQRYGNWVSGVLHDFLPGCRGVQNIGMARVPIVRYQQQLLELDCDLSIGLGSHSGNHMSELLFLYGELDPRVRPLLFVVRRWAREHGLIEDARPTSFFTNFILTTLVVFFLQSRHGILPAVRELHALAGAADQRTGDDGADFSFLSDFSGVQHKLNRLHGSPADPSVAELLADFFAFYAEFDFSRWAACPLSGEAQPKRTAPGRRGAASQGRSSFYMDVTNPLEPDLNVSNNVQQHAVDRFQAECRGSADLVRRMLGGSQPHSLSDLLSGGGPFTLNFKVSSLDWAKEEISKADEEVRTRVRVTDADAAAAPPTDAAGPGEKPERTYVKERKRRLKPNVPSVQHLFKNKF